jgi:hypothetical protein
MRRVTPAPPAVSKLPSPSRSQSTRVRGCSSIELEVSSVTADPGAGRAGSGSMEAREAIVQPRKSEHSGASRTCRRSHGKAFRAVPV